MIEPPTPFNEAERLRALQSIGVLDTPPDPGLDSLTRHLAHLWSAPMVAVSLIDRDRQWFKARVGLAVESTPRRISFCGHLLTQPNGKMVIPDALADIRFADNPLVTGAKGIRFYAGSALRDEAGMILGSLCVIDRRPRTPSPRLLQALDELAMTASSALILHRSVSELADLVTHDPLTGVLNRKGIESYFARLSGPAAVLLLDLDGFKKINDALGHAAGDAALCEVARRLEAALREVDAVARLGGDEFAIILGGRSETDEVARVAERVHRALAKPFVIGGTQVTLATSIGIACRPRHGDALPELSLLADAALYVAKVAGRSLTRFTVAAGNPIAAPLGRATLTRHLIAAIRDPEQNFRLVFQPIFDTTSGATTSVEALIRWTVEGTPIGPDVFIPLAESLGFAPDIDRYVVRAASAAAAAWPATRRLAVNFSALSIGPTEFADDILACLRDNGFDPNRLTVELTETAVALMPDDVCRALRRLVVRGPSVALDDFGAGQTSFGQLRHLPLRTLKIDRSLVCDAAINERGRKILKSLAELGRELGIIVVAEGIETVAELELVRSFGVPRVQGFLLARPVPLTELEPAIIAGRAVLRRSWTRHLQSDAAPRRNQLIFDATVPRVSAG